MNASKRTPVIAFELLAQRHCTADYLGWLKDPDVNAFLEVDPSSLTINALRDYVSEGVSSCTRVNFAIVLDSSHIGNCSLYTVEGDEPSVFRTGWFIGEKRFWGGHVSTSVMFMMFEIGFEIFEKEMCIGAVHRCNAKARISNRYIGFEEVGTYVSYSKRRQCNVEAVRISLDRDGWRARRSWLVSRHPEIYGHLGTYAKFFANSNPDSVLLI